MMHSIATAPSSFATPLTKTLRLGVALLLACAMATAHHAFGQDLPDVPPQAGAAITVTNANDSGAGSLRQAIADINTDGTIDFDASLSGQTITLASELSISKGLTIDGSSLANPIMVSGNNAVRVMVISGTGTINLTSLILADGAQPTANGGAIEITGTPNVTISSSVIRDNAAGDGNTSQGGGGIWIGGGTLVVNNSTISGNSAPALASGGGLFVQGGSVTLNNSTLSGNNAGNSGAGIFLRNASTTVTLNNTTVAANQHVTGGSVIGSGIYVASSGSLALNNALLGDNEHGADCYVSNGTVTFSAGQSTLIENDASGANACGTAGVDYRAADANLSALASSGSATQTHLLNFPSDAIDNGDAAICAALPGGDQDQRGTARVGTCDIGAVEFTGARPASLSPASGPASTATAVAITGTGFTGATGVTFGGTAGTTFSVDSDTQISVTTPAGSAGAVDVVVQHPNGTGTLADGYTFVDNGSIGDFVWNDLDGDGTQDGGEPGLSGVTVYIDANTNGALDVGEPSATTDGSGAYDLTALAAGTYSVRVDPSTVPSGFVLTGGTVPTSVTLTAGQDVNTADFGYQQQDASTGDFVWNDLDGDGTQDGGEPGLSGVTVFIDANTNGALDVGESSATTDGSGAYDLTGLAAGTYSVRVDPSTVPAGFVLTGGAVPTSVTLAAGQDVNTADFGYQAQTDLTITNTNGATTTVPGTQVTYTIVATNTGLVADPSVAVSASLPASLTNVTFTSVASGGATGNTAAGAGALSETINLPAGASVTYTVTGTVASLATGNLAVTASLTPSIGDTDAGNNSATDTDTLTPRADLEPLTLTDNADPVIEGENVTYTITVRNNGPSDATGVAFDVTLDGVTTSDIAIGTIASGGTGQGTFTTSINSAATLTASATVSAATTLTNTGNDTITETTTGIAAALTVAIAEASISESGGSTTATVTRNSGTSGALTVSLSSSDTGEATVPASVQIPDGQASATFTVTAVDDAIYDLAQTVTVTASAAAHTDGSDTVEIADNEALPALSVDDVTVNENAGTAVVTVSIDTESVQDVSVVYATSDGTAVAGSDYTTASGTATITAGQTSVTFNVSITDDATDEESETLTVTLSTPSNATIGDATGTLTITDDDAAPTLSIADVTVGEGDGTATLTVSLSAVSGQSIAVDYATSNGTATAGSDYTATSGTLTFNAGETSKTFDITVADDAVIEGSETLTATLTNPTNATLADASGTLTINDNDGALQVSIADVTVSEGAGTATLTVSLNAATGSDVTVDYSTADGNATAGSDYTATSGQATITAGQTSTTFTVAIAGDALDEADESFTVTLSNASAGTFSDSEAVVTITDDDDAPALSIADVTVGEGDGAATVTVSLSAASGQAVAVNYATSDGTATAGSDYTATSGTLTFNAGETTKTFDIAVTDDAVIEGSETLTATLSNAVNATIADATGTVTINDNDGALQVSIADVTVSEGAGAATLTVSLNAATGTDVTVDYATADGSATAGSDYTATSGQATITAGQTSTAFTVPIADDALDEVDETFTVALSNASAGTFSDSEAVVTITDDDAAPSISIDDVTVGEGGGTATLTVSLSTASGQTVGVDYATSDGTATAGDDYTATSGSLVFAAGETSKTFDVTITDDAVIEGSETVTATLSNPTNATLADASATVTINDNDGALQVSIADVTVGEGAGTATLTVSLNAATGSDVTVEYATSDGSATAGSDYTATSGQATITAGQTSTTFTVPVNDDVLDEADETFTVTLSNASAGTFSDSEAVVTITDDDAAPSLSIADVTVGEGDSAATLTVSLSAASGQPITVDYATADGTATADSDYTSTSGTLTFNAGETSKTFDITVADDAVIEGSETLTATLTNPTNATLADASGTLTINDNDGALQISIADVTVGEGAGTATLTVSLNAATGTDVTVDYSTADGSATAGSDYTATSGQATITAGQSSTTFTIPIDDDVLDEADETFTVTLSNASAGTIADSEGVVTITDDDAAPSLSIADVTVGEGDGTGTLTVSLSTASGQVVSVDYATSNGTATAGSDYTATSGSLTFSAGETTKTFDVAVSDDGAIESSETVVATLTNPTNATLTDATGTLTITDNDTGSFSLTESASSTQVSESGTTDTFTAVLDVQPPSDVVLTVTSGDTGEATVSPSTLTFTPANWNQPQTVTVTGVDDVVVDGSQTTTVTVAVDDANSDDAFDALANQTISVTTTDDDAAGFTLAESDGGTSVSESGTTDTFTAVLNAQPSSDVVLSITSNDTGEATVNQSSLTFTSVNWNQPQTVTVTGVDDAAADGNQTTTLTVAIDDASSDDDFDALADQTVSVTTTDDDAVGFTLTESGGSTEVSESGTTDTFTAVLNAQPTSDVVLTVTSGDTGEATVDQASLTFTSTNWNQPQTVTVTGVDDAAADGNQTTTITVSVDDASSDDAFDVLADQIVGVTTTDDDSAGFTLAESGGNTEVSEAGTSDTFTAVLNVQPTSDVVLIVTSGDTGEATVDQASLTFTSANWNQPQTVTVTGVDDAAADGNQITTITVSVDDASSDDAFDNLPDQAVNVTTTDDDAIGFTLAESNGSTSVAESGTTDTFTAVLDAQPSSDVVLTVTSGDTGEATVDQASLTFTSANWNQPQTVTVTGVDDNSADGSQTTSVTVAVNDAGSDDSFDALADQTVTVTTTDDDQAGFVIVESGGATTVSESGTTDAFTVALTAQPATNVVIEVSSDDTGEATVAPSTLTFTSANWNQPQTVTATGVDDDLTDGSQTSTLTLQVAAASSDDAFDNLPDQAVSITTTDDDVAGLTITETDGSTSVTESGTTDTFTVVLDAQPASNVVLSVSSSDTGEATVDQASLTFTPANWNQPQTVTVTGVDDAAADGNQTTTITVSVDDASSDDAFDNLPDQAVSVTTTDDDAVGFTLTESAGSTQVSESGTTDTFTAVLNAQPSSDVVLGVSSGDTGEATVDQASLTFTSANWNQPQTVTVTGVDDAVADGAQTTTLTVAVDDASSDDAFDALADQTVSVTTTDDDAAGFTLTESAGSTQVSESGTTDTFTVVLNAQPSSDVALTVTSGDTGEATVSPSTLTFTSANWNQPQTVTVTGADDDNADGSQTTSVTVAVDDAASDDAFDALTDQTIDVTTTDDDVNGFTVAESDGSTEVSESGTTDTFTAVLNAQPASDVVLSVSSGDTGEATVDQSSLTFTPANWNQPQTVTVTGVDDAAADGNQATLLTIAVDDAASDDAFDPVPDQNVSVTTTDDDTAGFTLAESGGSTNVSESGTTDTFTAVLNAQPSSDVVLSVSSGDTGEATVSSGAITFTAANWNVPQAVTVTGVDDAAADGNQTTTVTVAVDAAQSDDAFDVLADQTVSVTTTDDDAVGFTVAESDGSSQVSESGTTDTFTAVLSAQPSSDVVLSVSSGDTGEATVDQASLTFTSANWNVPQTVTVTGVDDAATDGPQTTTITVSVVDASSDDAFDALPDQTVAVTTIDDDAAGFTIVESDGSTAVSESGTTDAFSVVLAAQPVSDVILTVTSDDTGEATVDQASLTFTSANWNVPQTVTVTGADDATVDGNQTSIVTLAINDAASDDAFDALADQTVIVTTMDDDTAGFTLVESGGGTAVAEGGTTDTFTAVLDAPPIGDVVLAIGSSDTGEATVSPSALTFTAANWNVPQTVTITGVDDATTDGAQTTTVTVAVDDAASDDAFDSLADQTVTVTTTDDDVAGFTVVESGGSTAVSESGTTDSFTAVLDSQPLTDVVLTVTSSDAGEAVVNPSSLTFTPATWNVPQTVTVTGVADAISDGNQTATVTVAVDDATSDDAFDAVADQTVTVTVTDNDPAPGLSIADVVVGEGDGTATLTVSLSAAAAQSVTVDYATANGTAEAGTDYTATSGTLAFAPGETAKTVDVAIVDDAVIEGREVFTMALSNPTNATLDDASADVSVDDNDGTLQISIADVAVAEGDGQATLTVSLNAPTNTAVTVDYATADGTAAAGLDYTAASGALTFAAGTTSETFTVPVIDDTLDEIDEAFAASLSNASTGTISDSEATVTITDNDNPPVISIADAVGGEDAGTVDVTVQLSAASSLPVTVEYATADGTAGAGTDYTANSGTATVAPGQTSATIPIAIANDNLIEPTEAFSIAIANPVNATLGTATAEVTLNDDDGALEVSIANVAVAEDAGTATLTIALVAPTVQAVTVSYATADGTATAGVDYTASSGTATVPSGATTTTISIPLIDDAIDEVDETFTVQLSNPSLGTILQGQAVVTVTDDDAAPGLSIADAAASEADDAVVVTLTLSAVSAQPVDVTYQTQDGTATAGDDYEPLSGTLTIPAGALAATLRVPLVDDAVAEAEETFRVVLSAPVNASIDRGEAVVTLSDDDARVDLQLTKDDRGAVVAPGQVVVYALTYENAGTEAASGVTLHEIVPAHTTFDAAQSAAGWQTADGIAYTLEIGALAPAATGEVAFAVRVNDTVPADITAISNTARIEDDGAAGEDAVPENNTATDLTPIGAVDFGDAPDSYGTTLAAGGARHAIGTLQLGPTVDPESDGTPSTSATADLDDGVRVQTTFLRLNDRSTQSFLQVESSAAGQVDAWIDFNQNGRFDHPAEHVGGGTSQAVVAGANTLSVEVPQGAPAGSTFLRVRLSSTGGLLPTGEAPDGEVEDYALAIADGEEAVPVTIALPPIAPGNENPQPEVRRDPLTGDLQVFLNGVLVYTAPWSSIIELTLDGSEQADRLVLDFGGFVPIPPGGLFFNGGGPATDPGDELVLTNGTATTIVHTFDNASDGQISVDGLSVFYTGLEPILDDLTVVNRTFTFSAADDSIVLRDEGTPGNGLSFIDSEHAEEVIFRHPTASLTVQAGAGDDEIMIGAIDATLAVPIRIEGGIGADRFVIRPSAEVPIVVEGGTPNATPGDALRFDLDGVDGAVVASAGVGAGTLTSQNREVVTFGGIEYVEEPIQLDIQDGAAAESDAAGAAVVRLSAASTSTVQVAYATTDSTATAGADYAASTGLLTFAPGTTEQAIRVDLVDDAVAEAAEVLKVVLSEPQGAALGRAEAILTISDDEAPLTLAVSDAEASEGASEVPITVTLSGPSDGPVQVAFATQAGTATPSDFVEASGVLNFAPGTTEQVIRVPLLDDDVVEGVETFTIALRDPVGATLANAEAEVTLRDDEPNLVISPSPVDVSESAAEALFEVRLSSPAAQALTVAYATADSTATAGIDYTATSGTLTFAPGTTELTVAVPLLNDATDEPDEVFTLLWSAPSQGMLAASRTEATIRDDDVPAVIQVVEPVLTEGEGEAQITVRLAAASGTRVTVDYATADGSAIAGADYTATSGTLTFAPGTTEQQITILLLDDALIEPEETLVVTLSAPTNATLSTPSVTVTIADDEAPLDVVAEAGEVANEEAEEVVVTVRLSGPAGQPVTVEYTTADGSATAGADYMATSGTLTFAPGVTEQQITIALLGDTADEPDETFRVELTNLSFGTLATGEIEIVLRDDDLPLPTEVIIQSLYPNPARGQATLQFALPEELQIRVAVYNVQGRLVREAFAGRMAAGYHEQALSLDGEAAGLYFVRIETPRGLLTRTLVNVR